MPEIESIFLKNDLLMNGNVMERNEDGVENKMVMQFKNLKESPMHSNKSQSGYSTSKIVVGEGRVRAQRNMSSDNKRRETAGKRWSNKF